MPHSRPPAPRMCGSPAVGRAARARTVTPRRPEAGVRPLARARTPATRRASASCSPSPAATAPASTGPSRPSSRRSSSTAPRCTCASRSCTTCTSCETLDRARRDLRRRDRRGAGGRARRVLRARRVARPCTTQAADRELRTDRRHLPAGHEGAPGGEAVRPRGLRHPARRPRRARGGRGHRGRGARRTSSSSRPPPTSPTVTVRDPEKVVWLSQTTLSVDETMETVARAARAVPRRCRTRRATTSATPPRTGRSR